MIDAGILDGDLVIVQRAQDARNGEIVVALAGDDESADEATVKTFYRDDGPHPPPAGERRARADLRGARPDPRPGRGGVPRAVTRRRSVHRTLDQELLALLRGASLECLVCGEFVLHDGPAVRCPECEMLLRGRIETDVAARYNSARRPGDRGAACSGRGKSGHRRAGRSRERGGESRRKVAQKTDRRRRVLRRRRR